MAKCRKAAAKCGGGVVAESIDGNAAWAPGGQVREWIDQMCKMNDQARTREDQANRSARLILAVAESLRESVVGCRGAMPVSCSEEYAFCTSLNEDQLDFDACGLKMGYAYSELSVERASLALMDRMGDLLAGLDVPGGWALRLVQMLGDCRGG